MSDDRCTHGVFLPHRCVDCEQEATVEDGLLGQNHRLAARLHGVEQMLEAAVAVVATNKELISELEAECGKLRTENAEMRVNHDTLRGVLSDRINEDTAQLWEAICRFADAAGKGPHTAPYQELRDRAAVFAAARAFKSSQRDLDQLNGKLKGYDDE